MSETVPEDVVDDDDEIRLSTMAIYIHLARFDHNQNSNDRYWERELEIKVPEFNVDLFHIHYVDMMTKCRPLTYCNLIHFTLHLTYSRLACFFHIQG